LMTMYGGSVGAGSLCAILQSIGAAGLGLTATVLSSIVGAYLGGAVS
jgi:hypothetical protein